MSLVGLGTDVVAVGRMAALLDRHGERFLARCFGPEERAVIASRAPARRAATVAARWAAKEAGLKALGGSVGHIPYADLAVRNDEAGQPHLVLSGRAAAALADRGGQRVWLSLSHERDVAVATVVIES